jgi:hypothetical protein
MARAGLVHRFVMLTPSEADGQSYADDPTSGARTMPAAPTLEGLTPA